MDNILECVLVSSGHEPLYIRFTHDFLARGALKDFLTGKSKDAIFALDEENNIAELGAEPASGASMTINGFRVYLIFHKPTEQDVENILRFCSQRIFNLVGNGLVATKLDFPKEYWSNPDSANAPIEYLKGGNAAAGANYVSEIIGNHCPEIGSILEFGCNSGATMAHLKQSIPGLHIDGVEINPAAVSLLRDELAILNDSQVFQGDMVDVVNGGTIPFFSYDLVLSKASFQCVHPSVDDLFWENVSKLSRRYILTIDFSTISNSRNFSRDYEPIFRRYGYELKFSELPALPVFSGYATKLFERKDL